MIQNTEKKSHSNLGLITAEKYYGELTKHPPLKSSDRYLDKLLEGGFRKVDTVHTGGPLVILYAQDLEVVEAAVRGDHRAMLAGDHQEEQPHHQDHATADIPIDGL